VETIRDPQHVGDDQRRYLQRVSPFFTGKQKFVDTAGRVERFSKKFGGTYSFQKTATPAGAGAAKK
jgi:hypothetical protein